MSSMGSGRIPKNENWIKCMEFASDLGWLVTFHVTEPVGHEYPGRVPYPFRRFPMDGPRISRS